MRYSWRWLSDFVELDGITPEQVADRFTLTVAELERIEKIGQGLRDILVGKIVSIAHHPNADRLLLIDVDIGGQIARGVSGAPNLFEGAVVPVALPGAKLPDGNVVRATDVRGVRSEVVVLSERELCLSDDHSGVMILPPDIKVGARLFEALPVEDTILEVDNKSITHRPDLWGHLGLAREIAAMTGRPLRPLDSSIPHCDDDLLNVSVENHLDCPRYMAMCFTGVRISPSPFWIRHRLRAAGLRPINNVVDLTNYLMLDLGNPLHAFDMRHIQERTIRVRRAAEGEAFRTLDGRDLRLTGNDLVISDAYRPVALAGVMGGENSEVLDDTTDVILEAATFNAGLIRRTAVRHGIRTDSSARFEKSLDPLLPPLAVAAFCRLLAEVSPGSRPASRVYDVARLDNRSLRIELDPSYVSKRLGLEVPKSRTKEVLVSLGFSVEEKSQGVFDVTVPSWRATRDVSIPEDLVEEVGRMVGYSYIQPTPPLAPVVLVPRQPIFELTTKLKKLLAGPCGMDEVMTYSFDSQSILKKIGYQPTEPLRVRNAISTDFTTMRVELAPNLLGVLERNALKIPNFAAFEIGRVFSSMRDHEGIPIQRQHLGMIAYERSAKNLDEIEALFRRVKGALEYVMDRMDFAGVSFVEGWADIEKPWMHRGALASMVISQDSIGYITRVHPATMKALDIKGAAIIAELDLHKLLSAERAVRRFVPLPRFPSIQADVSFVAPVNKCASDLDSLVRQEAGPLCVAVELISVYSGPPIPDGYRSLTFRMTFLAPDRTLQDSEVQAAVARVIATARERGINVRE